MNKEAPAVKRCTDKRERVCEDANEVPGIHGAHRLTSAGVQECRTIIHGGSADTSSEGRSNNQCNLCFRGKTLISSLQL